MEKSHLRRLAELVGVEPSFWDVFGNYYETSDDAVRAILAGMGFDVSSRAATRNACEAYETRRWRTMLPPVAVHRFGRSAPAFVLTIPQALAARPFRWHLECDNGVLFEDELRPQDSALVDVRTVDGIAMARYRVALPDRFAIGYHRLRVEGGGLQGAMALIAAPERCFLPEWYRRGERVFGLGSHLYALRSAANWGVGDFGTLTRFADAAKSLGADFVGIDPLHARLLRQPCVPSPYSPSSRQFLNPLYLDVTAIAEFAEVADGMPDEARIAAKLRDAPYVDYEGVADLKLRVLRALHETFLKLHPRDEPHDARRAAFELFRAEGGEALRRYAIYQGLKNRFANGRWQTWPPEYRRPENAEVQSYAEANPDEIEYHEYLQWLADGQLGEVAEHAHARGMSLGLYGDLAVGVEPTGAEAWANQDVLVGSMRFGAPPDTFSPLGQNWGNPPSHPLTMREQAYAPLVAMLRANMRHLGALRIDHAMALMRLYWIPEGASPRDGAYVKYPMDELLGVLALESTLNSCLVIGEDLGTVPEGFRETMASEGVLSYRVFYFERYPNGLFKRPDRYPEHALSIATTHDLPTVAGHWSGRDLALRRKLKLIDSSKGDDQAARDQERDYLVAALEDQHLLGKDFSDGGAPSGEPDRLVELTLAVERFLARSPSRLMMVNLDDVFLESEQLNLPGTTHEYPNWRRKVSKPVEALSQDPFLREVCSAVADERQGLSATVPDEEDVAGK